MIEMRKRFSRDAEEFSEIRVKIESEKLQEEEKARMKLKTFREEWSMERINMEQKAEVGENLVFLKIHTCVKQHDVL